MDQNKVMTTSKDILELVLPEKYTSDDLENGLAAICMAAVPLLIMAETEGYEFVAQTPAGRARVTLSLDLL